MSSHDAQAGTVLTVVHEPGAAAPGSALVFELCGPLGTAQAEAVAARIATRHRAYGVALEEKAGRYLVRLSRAAAAPGPKPGPPTAELLADLLQPPCLGTVPVTGHQRELLLAAVNRPGAAGRHIEQLHWSWSGPLDPGRFTAAWQSVTDREVVLRASFDWTGTPGSSCTSGRPSRSSTTATPPCPGTTSCGATGPGSSPCTAPDCSASPCSTARPVPAPPARRRPARRRPARRRPPGSC
ncbi:hypothetical protein O1157_00530 [Streptomyces albogriseolus]